MAVLRDYPVECVVIYVEVFCIKISVLGICF